MLGPKRRGIGRKLLTVLVVLAVVGGAVAPALAAAPASTWDGRIELTGTPSDGTSYQYDVQELDAVDNFTVNLTGHTNSEWDNVSAASVADGGSVALDVAGTTDPTGPSANGEPTVTFTGAGLSHSIVADEGDGGADASVYGLGDSSSDGTASLSVEMTPSETGEFKTITPNVGAVFGSDYGFTVDLYLSTGQADSTWQEGTKIGTWDPDFSSGDQPITLSDPVNVTGGQTYELEFYVSSSDNDGTRDQFALGADSSPSAVKTWSSVNSGYERYADVTVSYTTTDPGLDIDGDGTNEAAHSGELASGESVTYELASLGLSDDTGVVSTSAGVVDVAVSMQERTQTVDPAIGLNTEDGGGWMNYSSTLAEGETVSLVTNESWVRSGTNTVDVAFNDGLSADAPAPKVQLDYSHRAATEQAVSVDAEQWSERWNTSRTWASDRSDAALTIPFGDNVVATRDVTVLSNGSQIGATSTSFNGTHLSVGLGDVEDGETTRVVAAGSKVQTTNGSIEVVEPTALGQSLDTKFEVVERSPGFQIDVGSTEKNQWLHYSHGESWSDPQSSALLEEGGDQSLRFPNAPAGGTARVSTLAVDVDTSQDVAIDVAKPGSLVFDVENGPTAGDDVTFNYVGATSGTEYELVSLDRDGYRISRDSGSTAILRDDDSAETLQIRPINSTSTGTVTDAGGGGGGGIPPAVDPRANPYALLAMSGVVIMGGVGLAAWRPSIPMWAVVPLLVPVTLIVIATQSPGTLRQLVAGKIGTALEQVGPALILLGGTIVSYVVYKLAQSLGPDRTTVNFKGLRGGKK